MRLFVVFLLFVFGFFASAQAQNSTSPPLGFGWNAGVMFGAAGDSNTSVNSTAPGAFYRGGLERSAGPFAGAFANFNVGKFGSSPVPFGTWYLGIGPMLDVTRFNDITFNGLAGGFPVRTSGDYTQADFLAALRLTTPLSADYSASIFGALGGATVWANGRPTGLGGPQIQGSDTVAAYRIGIELLRRIGPSSAIGVQASWDHRDAAKLSTSLPGEQFRFGPADRFKLGFVYSVTGDDPPPPVRREVLIQDKPKPEPKPEEKKPAANACPVTFLSRKASSAFSSLGKEVGSTKVDCSGFAGTLHAIDGINYSDKIRAQAGIPDGEVFFGIAYEQPPGGPQCTDCTFLQFFWIEFIPYKGDTPQPREKKTVDMSKAKTSGADKFTSATDDQVKDGKPGWTLDGYYKYGVYQNWPYGGDKVCDECGAVMLDKSGANDFPGPGSVADSSRYDKVVSVMHFETYLVCRGKACGKVAWSSTRTWNKGDKDYSTPTYKLDSITSPAPLPNADQLKDLRAKAGGNSPF